MSDDKNLPARQPIYTNIGPVWELGGRQVRWASEWLGKSERGNDIVRRCLLDAETGWEVQFPLDLGSLVVHPIPGGAYPVHGVVDADQQKVIEGDE